MPDFEILPHTADTGFRARGDSLEDLFVHAAEALISIALDNSGVDAYAPRHISATGADPDELLVNFLNEVLYLLDAERFVPARFETLWLDQSRSASEGPAFHLTVTAHLLGEPRDDARHPPRIVVKAATFHQLPLAQHNEWWEAEVYLDI